MNFETDILPLKDQLYRFALSMLGQAADAQDVVQDVLLKVWETVQGPHEIRNLEAYCITMTKHRALDKLRKHGRHYDPVEEQLHLPSSEADPFRQAAAKDDLACFERSLATLPANQREALHLREVAQYSYAEIAEVLQVSVNQVKTLLHRARARVREQLIQTQQHGISNPSSTR